MDTSRYSIHGVTVALRTDVAAVAQALEELLGAYGSPPTASPELDPPPDLVATLLAAAGGFKPAPAAASPLISYGAVHGQPRGAALVLSDGFSELVIDAAGRRLEGMVHPESMRAPYVFAVLLFNLALQLALRHHGLYYTHAAAVGDPRGPLLLVGNSGAGKTTLTLALVAAGLPYLSDDAIFLQTGSAGVSVLPFRRPLHLDGDTLRLFPGLAPRARGPFERASRLRWDLDPYACFPGQVRERAAAPAMLVLLQAGDRAPSLAPITRTAALQGLLPQSGLVMLGSAASRPHLETLAKVVRSGANFALARGSGSAAGPDRLAEALRLAYEAAPGL
ncbi:MAG: hypothetical protein IPL40_07740 [Proteobacteria bacterium]|nr:hypothetical protein [Pseudomonadota bacterium]